MIFLLYSSRQIVTRSEFEKQNQGWFQWGTSLLRPATWLQSIIGNGAVSNTSQSQLIHLPTLKVPIHYINFSPFQNFY